MRLQMKKITAITTMIVALFSFSASSFAEYDPYEELVFDNKKYSVELLIEDFLSVAFSDEVWGKHLRYRPSKWHLSRLLNGRDPEKVDDRLYNGQNWYNEYLEYIKYPEGLPRHNVINKWETEITIGFGSPGNTKPIPIWLLKHLNDLIPQIQELTGLPVKLQLPDSEMERSKNFARIRIILESAAHSHMENYFKFRFYDPDMSSQFNSLDYMFEWLYPAAIPFTPKARSQVDGYILPNGDNTIGAAVCKIAVEVGEDLASSLITECLTRALGFPQQAMGLQQRYVFPENMMVKGRRVYDPVNAVLGNWNSVFDDVSKLDYFDGRPANWIVDEEGMIIPQNVPTPIQLVERFPKELVDKTHLFKQQTDYDKLLISILYCPEIKPGMDKLSALLALKNSECFSNLISRHKRGGL